MRLGVTGTREIAQWQAGSPVRNATRRPTLLGVDVDDGGAAAGLVEATGWLEREDVRQDELDAQLAAHGQFAHRGAGTFYRLVAVEGGQLARPRAAY